MSDDECHPSAVCLNPSPVKSVPLRPGELIRYFNDVFIAGNSNSIIETTVLEINVDGDPILLLANGVYLPSRQEVKIISRDGGKYRSIENYNLISGKCSTEIRDSFRDRLGITKKWKRCRNQ